MIQPKTNWDDLFKIRLKNPDESFDKHEVIKLLIVRKILRKYKRKSWLRIYTEFQINSGSGLIPDVYVEHLKDKSIVCYEIQKELDVKYVKEKTDQYNKLDIPYFNSVDLIIVPLKDCPDNISEINKWLEQYVI